MKVSVDTRAAHTSRDEETVVGSRPGEGSTDNSVRPLLLGYVRMHLLMTENELEEIKESLASFASVEGFRLKTIYVEQLVTTPAAFEALVEAVHRHRVTAVVLPSMLHLAVLGAPLKIRDTFERATGARVLVASST